MMLETNKTNFYILTSKAIGMDFEVGCYVPTFLLENALFKNLIILSGCLVSHWRSEN